MIFFQRLKKSRLALYGGSVVLLVVLSSLLGPYLISHHPATFTSNLLRSPSSAHLLGTDDYGRDLLSRILNGGRITLSLALIIITLSGVIGTFMGVLAAYTKGMVSILINRGIDLILSFPSIMIALLVVAIAGAEGRTSLIIAITITLIPRFARVIRGSTLPILEEDYIDAVRALGGPHGRIILYHILPNLVAPITVLMSIYLPFIIMLESSLSFLGLGAPPDIPTWGRIIADGKAYMRIAPWLTIFPGVAILITSLGFNLLGDGLRDLFDPRSATRLFK